MTQMSQTVDSHESDLLSLTGEGEGGNLEMNFCIDDSNESNC